MNRRKHISLRKEHGQTMTEFALVLPLLALLLFAVIQFGIVFNNYLTVTDAARAGARKAAVSKNEPDPAAAAEEAVRGSAENLDQDELEVAVGASPGWEHGADVAVSASYPYEISLIGVVVASGELTSTTTERVE
jgi:Flp pilus assembly protein TadG